jgi:hypothetical protein
MRLITFELFGYGRFVKAKVNVDSRLVAVLGPNEAGKSSLLRALGELNHEGGIPPSALWRGDPVGPGSKLVLQALFLLDESDIEALEHLPGGRLSRWLVVSKWSTGRIDGEVLPPLERDPAPLGAFVDHLKLVLDRIPIEPTDDDQTPSAAGEQGYRGNFSAIYLLPPAQIDGVAGRLLH